jgi:putative acetyltransferase
VDTLTIRDVSPADAPAVRRIVSDVLREYGLAFDPIVTDADLDDLPANYTDRGGCFRVIVNDRGDVVGCGGLYALGHGVAEIRKMYLQPAVRGRGWGRKLLEDLVAAAAALGFSRVTLETASVLREAVTLYRAFGFVETPCDHLSSRCDLAFSLDLGPRLPPASTPRR